MTSWQPMNLAPKDGRQILAYDSSGEYLVAQFHQRQDGSSFWEIAHDDRGYIGAKYPLIAWMPLPAQPEEP